MKVALDLRYAPDTGVGRYAHELARPLAQRGRHDYRFLRRIVLDERTLVVRPGPYTLAEQIALPLALRRAKLDLLHCPHFIVPLAWRGPLVVTIHDVIPLDFPQAISSPLARASYPILLRYACRRAARVLVPSQATADALQRHALIREHRVVVTPPAPTSIGNEEQLRELPVDGPYVLYVGQLKPHKQPALLLHAHARLTAELRRGTSLVFVGDGPERRRLELLATKGGIAARVRFLTRVSDAQLSALYMRARAVVLPSRVEGAGLPVLEAMAHGAPVVISDAPALLETAAGAALVVAPMTPETLAAALQRLLGDDEIAAELRERGFARTRALSWEETARATEAVYEQVVA